MRRVSKCTSMFVPTMHERGNIVITCRQFSTWVNNAQFSCPFLSLPPFPLNGIHEVSARDFVWTDGISTEISRLNPWDTKGGRFLSKIVRGANSFKVRILENCFWEYCWLILKNTEIYIKIMLMCWIISNWNKTEIYMTLHIWWR